MVGQALLIEVVAAWRDDQLMMQVADRLFVLIPERLLDGIARGNDALPVNTAFVDRVPGRVPHVMI
jgi:hypothetical protein